MNLTNKLLIPIFLITSFAVSTFTYLQIRAQSEILDSELQQRTLLLKNNLESNAKSTAIALKESIENDLAALNLSHIDATLKQLTTKKESDAILLTDSVRSIQMYAGNPALKTLIPRNKIGSMQIVESPDSAYFIVSAPIVLHQAWGELHMIFTLEKLHKEITKAEITKQEKIAATIARALYTALLLGLILLVSGYFFARHLTMPILMLTATAKKIAHGNLDVSDTLSTIKTKDEVGMLAESFIDMSRQLSVSYSQMHLLNQNLERKTHQLEELNESLEEKVAGKVAQLREQEQMMIAQSRLAAMGEMMSMIAHQWRQPLSTASLLIANEKISCMMNTKTSTPTIDSLDKISDIILYLSHLIDDFQTYFKPEKSAETVAISSIIERSGMLLQTRLKYEQVDMDVMMDNDVSIETYANEIVQVLINIINNAIDALLEHDISERRIWLRIWDDAESVSLEIEDNASGIPETIIDRIFEPYFSTKSKNGTGLGLYMAKMIIEKHTGGTLSVANSKKGACFTIHLPKMLRSDSSNTSTEREIMLDS